MNLRNKLLNNHRNGNHRNGNHKIEEIEEVIAETEANINRKKIVEN